jgi:hypothetical protein
LLQAEMNLESTCGLTTPRGAGTCGFSDNRIRAGSAARQAGDEMISWIDFRDFFEINTGLYGATQAPLPPAEMMVALLTVARATHGVDVEQPEADAAIPEAALQ